MGYPYSQNVVFIFLFFVGAVFITTKGFYYFLKNPKYHNTLAKAFILLIIISIGSIGIYKSYKYSDKFANDHEPQFWQAAKGYVEEGFFSNYGLPNYQYEKITKPKLRKLLEEWFGFTGDKADLDLIKKFVKKRGRSGPIYTHLPPGPYLMVGAFTKACGIDNLKCVRLVSTAFSTSALIFFVVMLLLVFTPVRSAILLLAVAVIPMTIYFIHSIHYYNYAHSLLLVQLGVLLYLFKKKILFNKSHLSLLFILGFIQGWFTFEYFFIISFSAIPLALLYYPLDQREYKKQLIFAVLLPLTGLVFAYLLHFIQNSLFFGSVTIAFNDFFSAASGRTSGAEAWGLNRIELILNYFFILPKNFRYFKIDFAVLSFMAIILIWFKDIRLTLKDKINIVLKWSSSRRHFLVIFSAFLISFAWIAIMTDHAAYHPHYVPRILFFYYFCCVLTILECISTENPVTQDL